MERAMSKGSDSRTSAGRDAASRGRRSNRDDGSGRNSRSSVRMTAERARAIQAHADRTGANQDFKARAMSAADRNDEEEE